MTVSMWFFGVLGATIPDLIRMLQAIRDGKADKLNVVELIVSISLSVILGLLAVWVSEATKPKQALIVAAGAPAVLTKLIAAVATSKDARRDILVEGRRYLVDWWRT